VSALVAASPELKRLWIRVLKRVHPDLAVDEQDRRRCERLTQQANDAFARRDEVALRAVLEPKGPLPPRPAPSEVWEARFESPQAASPQSTYQPPMVPQRPPTVVGREALGLFGAACAVLCLLIYGVFDALSEEVGRITSLSFLVLLTVTLLWLIIKNSNWPDEQKRRWVAAVASGMILVGICLLNSHPTGNPLIPSARAATADPFQWRSTDNLPQSYSNVIKTRVAQSWNPSAVADRPAGATAGIEFTISRDGSPRDVELNKPSGSPSFDFSCLQAVQRVRTFGPTEGGNKGGLYVHYPCSYNEIASMNAHLQRDTNQERAILMPPSPERVKRLEGYIEAAKNKVAQKWNSSEVAGGIPAGATVYIQFAIRRRGSHEVPTMETSSGYSSLDTSCLKAVERIRTFDHLPTSYSGDSLTVLYHCTYPGLPTTRVAQDSTLPPVQQPANDGPADAIHGAQRPMKDPVGNN
jgi:TonB family protein